MRVVSERQLAIVLGALAGTPRVVAGGNFATPWRALAVLDGTVARYRLPCRRTSCWCRRQCLAPGAGHRAAAADEAPGPASMIRCA